MTETTLSFDTLDSKDRMQLMKFICSFAWADLQVKSSEKAFVSDMVRRLELSGTEQAQVEAWLELPPAADELDPTDIPKAHRQLFLDAARAMILADGSVEQEEAENLALLDLLMR
ncbi:MAG: TerB family tellurite resistance protein [Myxococcota bacterium]